MEKKYIILTDKTLEFNGHTLHRIKALKDFSCVKKGDIGGWVECENNLSRYGDCWIYDDAKVMDSATVLENANVSGNAEVYGRAKICGDAWVWNNAKISGEVIVNENAVVGLHFQKVLDNIFERQVSLSTEDMKFLDKLCKMERLENSTFKIENGN